MALRLALDTNRYCDYVTGVEEALQPVRSAAELLLPFTVLGELRAGFRHGRKARSNEETLSRFLRSHRVNVLWADEGTTHFYAELYAELRRAGTPIPTNDLWIAALVVQHDLVLFTRDAHFDRVARVPRL